MSTSLLFSRARLLAALMVCCPWAAAQQPDAEAADAAAARAAATAAAAAPAAAAGFDSRHSELQVAKHRALDACNCHSPARSYTRTPTPEVLALFEAARNADEAAFARLIAQVTDVQEYAVEGRPLLSALLNPVKELDRDRPGAAEEYWEMSPALALGLRQRHEATLPAKTRMLALALEKGASVQDISSAESYPPLHLALTFGTPEMVRLLLRHGADPNQRESFDKFAPLEFLFDNDRLVHNSRLPPLVNPAQRTQMALALLQAGAQRPYRYIDERMRDEPTATRVDRPAADYLLWPLLAAKTEGGAVMQAMSQTGTLPAFDAGNAQHSPLAYAARAGNPEGVRWLLPHAPQRISDANRYGTGENQLDPRLAAAVWALYPEDGLADRAAHAKADAIMRTLLHSGMAWTQDVGISEITEHLLNWRVQATPRTGRTLLHHLAASGEPDWVQRAVALGAPVDGMAPYNQSTPLGEAVEQGRPDMVRLLLKLGANPLAGEKTSSSILDRAMNPEAETQPGAPDSPDAKNSAKRTEVLQILLAALTPQQKATLAAQDKPPLAKALQWYSTPDPQRLRLLLQAGFTLQQLDGDTLRALLRSGAKELPGELLARGLKVPEPSSASSADPSERPSPALRVALQWEREDLLPALLAAGASPDYRDRDDLPNAVEWAVLHGRHDALDIFLAHGARLDAGDNATLLLKAAVLSGDERMLQRIAQATRQPDIASVCLADDTLFRLLAGSSDAYWHALLQQGLGKPAPACASGPAAARVLQTMLKAPFSHINGWPRQRMLQRVTQLWNAAPPPPAQAQGLAQQAQAAGRDDLLEALQRNGVRPASTPTANQQRSRALPAPSAAERALSRRLAGHYYLDNVREVGSEIVLRPDGRFVYMLAYGASDENSTGTWTVHRGRVELRSTPAAPASDGQQAPFVLRQALPATGPDRQLRARIRYRGEDVGSINMLAIGCQPPDLAAGQSDSQGPALLDKGFDGPVCGFALQHPQIFQGKAFHIALPETQRQARQFVFDLTRLPDVPDSTPLDASLRVDGRDLLWERGGRTLRYVRPATRKK